MVPLMALTTWPELSDGLWVHFIDNEAARNALIRGSSSVCSMNMITSETWRLVRTRQLHLGMEGVSSEDNPLDGTSRGDLRDLLNFKWRQVLGRLPEFTAMQEQYLR